MDKNRSATLDGKELRIGLEKYGIALSDVDFTSLLNFFDRDGDGTVSVTEFIRGVRGPISDWRKTLVQRAFVILDKDNSGIINFSEMCEVYSAKKHPDVVAKRKTEEQVIREFIAGWFKSSDDGDSEITWDEFVDYYSDISAGIDNDQYFELMIRNAWHITGGEGAAANTSNLRVLVTHTDGTEEVVCVESDLGLDKKNMRAIEAALMKQGVRNIFKVSLAM